MKYKSQAQRRKIRELEDQGKLAPGTADKWDKDNEDGDDLPDRAGPRTTGIRARKTRKVSTVSTVR